MSEQMKESIEIHSLEELKKLIMEKDDNEILTVTVEVAADESWIKAGGRPAETGG